MNYYHDRPLISPGAFQTLIRERTEERKKKSEEKRQADLQRIVDLKSKDGIDPLALFPKEIWQLILDESSPEDRGNAWKVHPMFQVLMETNRIRDILFPQVLKLVLDHVNNNDGITFWVMDDILESEISQAQFLKLRQVSKNLRLAVDRWFEEKIDEQLKQRSFKPKQWNAVPGMVFRLYRSQDQDRLNGLIANYGTTTGNDVPPAKVFYLRSIEVIISLKPDGDDDSDNEDFARDIRNPNLRNDLYLPFKASLLRFLELIGDQMLSFKLRIDPVNHLTKAGLTLADHYVMLRECCELMPNLKRLEIYFEMEYDDYYPKTTKKVPVDLTHSIEMSPFPTLEKLERFSFEQDQCYHVTQGIYDSVLKANSRVKMLKFFIEDKLLKRVSKDVLKALKLDYFSWDNTASDSPRSSYKSLCKSWPLKTLNIRRKSETLARVIKSLNAFPTLEKLTVFLASLEILKDNKFLMLPNLTHLDLKFTVMVDQDRDDANFFFSLQFLVHAKKLKKLRWNCCHRGKHSNVNEALLEYLKENECPEKMVDFRGGMRDLKTSNIWNVFPKLEMVETEVPKFGSYVVGTQYRPGKLSPCKICHEDLDLDG